jgi:phenylalanyl-tRNA synthetase alpha chain
MDNIRKNLQADLAQAAAVEQVDEIRTRYLGRKGVITTLMKATDFSDMDPEQRRQFGRQWNELKAWAEEQITRAGQSAKQRSGAGQGLSTAKLDITLPGTAHRVGAIHPAGHGFHDPDGP